MDTSIKIKICGIINSKMADYAAKNGADYIGLMFYKKSKRYVKDINIACEIAETSKKSGAEPVAVFVDSTIDEILKICKKTQIQIVQLHGEISKNELVKLPANYTKILAVNVDYNGKIIDTNLRLNYINPKKDYLLFDGINSGSGKSFTWNNFFTKTSMRFFLAGGLNPNNIKEAVSIVNPYGVDVSSGVENNPGEKSKKKFKSFINQARGTI